MTRPECFEFAMSFLGAPESAAIVKYVEELEKGVVEERKRIVAALRAKHEQHKQFHNYYACTAREIEDGVL